MQFFNIIVANNFDFYAESKQFKLTKSAIILNYHNIMYFNTMIQKLQVYWYKNSFFRIFGQKKYVF